ncbi:hypothetical protein NQ318_009029 [Aromia moschata]|uniref:Uncharacterized protein n=1 Tax=Aromia moschata TaxID=1265417 RepID=A0AAV8YUE9_9CUCU|nr:hypothetical protein NQ318_009029 [Aromia moschata]
MGGNRGEWTQEGDPAGRYFNRNRLLLTGIPSSTKMNVHMLKPGKSGKPGTFFSTSSYKYDPDYILFAHAFSAFGPTTIRPREPIKKRRRNPKNHPETTLNTTKETSWKRSRYPIIFGTLENSGVAEAPSSSDKN